MRKRKLPLNVQRDPIVKLTEFRTTCQWLILKRPCRYDDVYERVPDQVRSSYNLCTRYASQCTNARFKIRNEDFLRPFSEALSFSMIDEQIGQSTAELDPLLQHQL